MKKKYTIAVSGLNNTDNPGPGIPVIRALRESPNFDVRIIGISYEALEPGIYMHELVDKVYQVPYPSAGQDALLERIRYIHEKEKIDFIIPNFDAELFSFMKVADVLDKMGIKTFLPTVEQFEERHKVNLDAFGKKYGIRVPKSRAIASPAEIPSLAHEFSYPMVVKGKFYDAYIAYTPEQVYQYFNKISAKWGLPIIIQQFVYGTEYNVVALGDGNGNTIGAVPMRKKFITDKGKAWAGITIQDEKLMQMTRKLIKESKWRGGMELELMKSQNDGELYLVEINPRFPAWVYLGVAAGQNMPEAMIRLAFGETVKPFADYEVGKLFIRYSYDLICDLKEFEQISTVGEL